MKQTLLGYPLALGAAGCFVAGESSGFLINPAISSRPSPGNHVPFCKGREDELRDDMRLGCSPRLPRAELFPCNREQNLVCWGVGHWFAFHLTVEKMSEPDLRINSKCPKASPHDFCLGTDLPDRPIGGPGSRRGALLVALASPWTKGSPACWGGGAFWRSTSLRIPVCLQKGCSQKSV